MRGAHGRAACKRCHRMPRSRYWAAPPSPLRRRRSSVSHRDITSIGKYQILDLVGEGAMGVVYRATDSVLNRTVAVKVMSDAIARQGDLRDRFLREAQAAGALQHPTVITIFDFGEVENHLFIAMEFVEGVDLEQLLASRQPLTLQAKLDLAIDVLNGLAYAHKRGIVHRDIKPANIRITEEGRAKIMERRAPCWTVRCCLAKSRT